MTLVSPPRPPDLREQPLSPPLPVPLLCFVFFLSLCLRVKLYAPQRRYVEVLTPGASEGDLIWEQVIVGGVS